MKLAQSLKPQDFKQDGTRTLLAFLRNESGATAIEYALIAAGVASAIVAAVNGLGTSVNGVWEKVGNAFN